MLLISSGSIKTHYTGDDHKNLLGKTTIGKTIGKGPARLGMQGPLHQGIPGPPCQGIQGPLRQVTPGQVTQGQVSWGYKDRWPKDK